MASYNIMNHLNRNTRKAKFCIYCFRILKQAFMNLLREKRHQTCSYCINDLKRPKSQICYNSFHLFSL